MVDRAPLPLNPSAPLPFGRQPPLPPATAPAQRQPAPQKATALWYAVCLPQLRSEQGQTSLENQTRLRELAELTRHLSSRISLLPPDCIVFEVRSSLRYFGGIGNIRRQLQALLEQQLQEWQLESGFYQCVTPTATSSVLLARNGANVAVAQSDRLRSVLGSLPLQSLPIPEADKKQLRLSGLLHLRDLWRLPGAALRQRFGNILADYLDRCLGRKTDLPAICEPLPVFRSSYELEYAESCVERLLPAVQDLLSRLCDFLRQRELSTAHLLLKLEHEAQAPDLLEMNLRRPSRCENHLMMLLENRISALSLDAPVTALSLEARYFDVFIAGNASLLNDNSPSSDEHNRPLQDLLEQLQARLGNAAIRVLHALPEHCPELASTHYSCGEQPAKPSSGKRASSKQRHQALSCFRRMDRPRPCWLLEEPESLLERGGHIYLLTPLQTWERLRIISEAERIETHWWAGPDVRRDYYVAAAEGGQLLWIFHSRSQRTGWYLQGVF